MQLLIHLLKTRVSMFPIYNEDTIGDVKERVRALVAKITTIHIVVIPETRTQRCPMIRRTYVVDLTGFEPVTSALQMLRSTS